MQGMAVQLISCNRPTVGFPRLYSFCHGRVGFGQSSYCLSQSEIEIASEAVIIVNSQDHPPLITVAHLWYSLPVYLRVFV